MTMPEQAARSSRSTAAMVVAISKAMLAWIIHLLVFMTITGVAIKLVPIHERIFQRHEMDVPAPTKLTFAISAAWERYWYLPGCFFLLVNPCILVGLALLDDRWRWLRRLWFVGVLLLAIGYLCYALIAITMPWAGLPETISA